MNGSTNAPARLSASKEEGGFVLGWRGDEDIQVFLPVKGGLLNQPITFDVDGKTLQFAGFSASMNGKSRDGWQVVSENSRLEDGRVIISQKLKHTNLEDPTQAEFQVWMTPEDKAVRFQIALEGPGQHLDYLGVGPHSGQGLACNRLYFGTCVIDGPIEPFELGPPGTPPETKYWKSTNRYWTLELENGLTEMQGMDAVPLGFTCRPGDTYAVYDMHTYCSSPITYTLVVTAKGGQEAFRQHSRILVHKPTKALAKLTGALHGDDLVPHQRPPGVVVPGVRGTRGTRPYLALVHKLARRCKSPDHRRVGQPLLPVHELHRLLRFGF